MVHHQAIGLAGSGVSTTTGWYSHFTPTTNVLGNPGGSSANSIVSRNSPNGGLILRKLNVHTKNSKWPQT